MTFRPTRRDLVAAGIGGAGAFGAAAAGWLALPRSERDLSSTVRVVEEGAERVVAANGLPGHATGDFPNWHDPIPIRRQSHLFRMPLEPVVAEEPVPLGMWLFGVAVNGVPFDPSGPFWRGDSASGWQFEVLHPGNAPALGIDASNAHTQIRGMYHYHGLPGGLIARLAAAERRAAAGMTLLGWAADGFAVYGPDCPEDPTDPRSPVRRLRSSWRVDRKRRAGGPGGTCDGRFVEDHVYDPGHGDLDECNGRTGVTPEHPDGAYHYVLTDTYPFVPRSWRGRPHASFRHGPPPGATAPLPPELRRFVADG